MQKSQECLWKKTWEKLERGIPKEWLWVLSQYVILEKLKEEIWKSLWEIPENLCRNPTKISGATVDKPSKKTTNWELWEIPEVKNSGRENIRKKSREVLQRRHHLKRYLLELLLGCISEFFFYSIAWYWTRSEDVYEISSGCHFWELYKSFCWHLSWNASRNFLEFVAITRIFFAMILLRFFLQISKKCWRNPKSGFGKKFWNHFEENPGILKKKKLWALCW